MFNSVAKYLWGGEEDTPLSDTNNGSEVVPPHQDATKPSVPLNGNEADELAGSNSMHECGQDDDWVLVGGDTESSTAAEASMESGEDVTTVTTQASPTKALKLPNCHCRCKKVVDPLSDPGRIEFELKEKRAMKRLEHPGQMKFVDLRVESEYRRKDISQNNALSVAQRSISKQKCRRQNQVREKGQSKSKQLCPSGAKSSRFSQRHQPSARV